MINYDEIEIKDREKDTQLLEELIKKADEDIADVIKTLEAQPNNQKKVLALKEKKALKDSEARGKRAELLENKELSDSEFAQEFLDLVNDLDLYNDFIIGEVNDILREVVKDLQDKVAEGEAKIDAINRYRKGQIAQQRFVTGKKLYPNDPCYCGSGKKFKKCCGKKI